MSKLLDLTGQRFGRLTVLSRAEDYISPKGKKSSRWLCQCDCGNIKVILGSALKNRRTRSCGCIAKEKIGNYKRTHGKYQTRIYKTWRGMKDRCLNTKHNRYPRYGGRGISICEEWLHFESFYEWAMAHGYRDGLSIDRINVNGNYEPSNCRWITIKKQANNKGNSRYLTFNGETHTMAEWSEITGINYDTIRNRLNSGWTTEQVLTTKQKKS